MGTPTPPSETFPPHGFEDWKSPVPSGPPPSNVVTVTVDYEKMALQEQVRGLVGYIAELRKHLHHHVGCLKGKNRWHLRNTDEECDMCRAELEDCARLLSMSYKSGTVAPKST